MKMVGPACVVAHGTPLLQDLTECSHDILFIPPGDEWELNLVKNAIVAPKIDVYFFSLDNQESESCDGSISFPDVSTNLELLNRFIFSNKITPITL